MALFTLFRPPTLLKWTKNNGKYGRFVLGDTYEEVEQVGSFLTN